MRNKSMKAVRPLIAGLLLLGLAPAANAASSPAQAKVVITGDFNVTLSDFVDPHVGVADAKNHTYGLTLTVAYPLLGEVEVYFPQSLEPGTYPASDKMTKATPVELDFYCTMVMSGDSTGCDSYTGYAKGALKLTKTGNVYSGSFDAIEKTVDGSHKVHVAGTFNDLPLKKK